MSKYITKEKYDYLMAAKSRNEYANHICNVPSRLGSIVTFKVENTELTLAMKATQKGGMFSGSYCYVVA